MAARLPLTAIATATALALLAGGCKDRKRTRGAVRVVVDATPAAIDAGVSDLGFVRGDVVIDALRDGRHQPVRLDPATRSWAPLGDGAGDLYATGHRLGDGLLAIATAGAHEDDHQEQLAIVTGARVARFGPTAKQVRNPSAAGGAVVFASDLASYSDLYAISPTAPPRRLTDDAAGNFEPALAPDGAQVAFASSRDGNAELYVQPVAGGAARRLTDASRDDWNPAWSPDGTQLAFLSDRTGSDRVHLIAVAGGEARRLSSEPGTAAMEEQPAWSPDGRAVAFVRMGGGRAAITIVDVATGATRTLTPDGDADRGFAWSPDGQAMIVARRAAGGAASVVLVRVADGAVFDRWPGDPAYLRWIAP